MITWSKFAATMMQNKGHVTPRIWSSIRQRGVARLTERMAEDRADSVLCFADLIEELDAAMIGR